MVNKAALDYLIVMIKYYTRRKEDLYKLIDISYSAFLDYANAKDFLLQLKNLYYKLTAKEYEEELWTLTM